MADFLTTAEVARHYAVDAWRVRRVFERGDVPEPPRFMGRRLVPRSSLPAIRRALVARGWLPRKTS